MDALFQLFDQIEVLEPALRNYLLSILVREEFEKKSILLKPGQIDRNIRFIEKGAVRSFKIKNGKERTGWFMMEKDIILSVESFFFQKKSTECIQLVEDSIFYTATFDQLQYAYTNFRSFNLHRAIILEKYYALSVGREAMRQENAKDKYLYLMENQPELITRVKDKYLASYLGMSPGTFSYQKNLFARRNSKK